MFMTLDNFDLLFMNNIHADSPKIELQMAPLYKKGL